MTDKQAPPTQAARLIAHAAIVGAQPCTPEQHLENLRAEQAAATLKEQTDGPRNG